MTDEDLELYLSGSMGLPGLDLARELLGTRAQLAMAQERADAASAQGLVYAAAAEMAMSEAAGAKARLHELAEALATACAQTRDYLGEVEAHNDDD